MSLAGKVAIVTGSGRGLGLAYAQELARQGAAVVVNDVDAAVAEEAVATITAAGGQAVAVVAAVGTTEVAQQLVRGAVEAFGRLDILVTNAGVLRDKSFLKMTDEDFDPVINVHLRGTFTCAREAFAYFKENGIAGRIIAIGSPTGQRGAFGQTNYAAAKAGIVGMVRTWALEMKRAGVTANAVIPVAVTAMTSTVPYFAKAVEADDRGEAMPDFFRKELGFGSADDVSGLIAFLASDEAAGNQRPGHRRRRRPPPALEPPGGDRVRVPRRRLGLRDAAGRLPVRRAAAVRGREVPRAPAELQPEPAAK